MRESTAEIEKVVKTNEGLTLKVTDYISKVKSNTQLNNEQIKQVASVIDEINEVPKYKKGPSLLMSLFIVFGGAGGIVLKAIRGLAPSGACGCTKCSIHFVNPCAGSHPPGSTNKKTT